MSISSKKGTFIQFILTFFMIGLLTAGCQANQTPPPGFELVSEIDLAAQSYDEAVVGEFILAETAVTTIFYSLPNADTAYFDLSLIGPDNDSHLILHSENYRTDASGGGTWDQNLPPGTYRLALTADQSTGVLTVYWKYH
jgi:hypothetical protein